MADEREFPIRINTTATGDGAQKTQADLEATTAKTEKLTAANEQLAASQKEASGAAWIPAPMPVEKPPESQEAVRSIAETKLAALREELAGRTEEAAILEQNAQIERMTVSLMRQGNMEREAAYSLAEQIVTAEAEITAQKEAQEALNAELIAQEEARLLAEKEAGAAANERNLLTGRGIRGMLGGAFGKAGMEAFGAYFIFELINRQVDKYVESVNKAAEAQIQFNAARAKVADEIEHVKSALDLQERRASIESQINDLEMKRAVADGEERDKLSEQIDALEGQAVLMDRLGPAAIQRAEAEERSKEAFKEQLDSLRKTTEAYEETARAAKELLDLQDKLAGIKEKGAIADINNAEQGDGKTAISHYQAEQARQKARDAAAKEKFDRDQAAAAAEIQQQQEQGQIAAGATGSTGRNYDYQNSKFEKAREERNAAQRDIERIAQEREDAQKQLDQANVAKDSADSASDRNDAEKKVEEAQKRASELDAAGKPAREKFSTADAELKKQQEYLQQAEELKKTARENEKKITDEVTKRVAELQREMDARKQIYQAETEELKKHEDPVALNKAAKKDDEESKQADERAKQAKEKAQREKDQQFNEAVQVFEKKISIAESQKDKAGMKVLEQQMDAFIKANSGANEEQKLTVEAIVAKLKEHEAELNKHKATQKGLQQQIKNMRATGS